MKITYKKSLTDQAETILSPNVEVKFINKDNRYSIAFTTSGKIIIEKRSISNPSNYSDKLSIEPIAANNIIIC
ncbi:MAG: hypothetical protein NUV47_01225 [Patescibacteria group bacterium]|nr:hypothetical protein [Patescibacteria group bacterium]